MPGNILCWCWRWWGITPLLAFFFWGYLCLSTQSYSTLLSLLEDQGYCQNRPHFKQKPEGVGAVLSSKVLRNIIIFSISTTCCSCEGWWGNICKKSCSKLFLWLSTPLYIGWAKLKSTWIPGTKKLPVTWKSQYTSISFCCCLMKLYSGDNG